MNKQRRATRSPAAPLAAGAVLVLVTIVAYVPALGAGFIWDDDDYVTDNPHLVDAAGLARIWMPGHTPQYYPLVFTSFWIEHALWGRHPFGYHLVNVLLHAANALLVWRIAQRLALPGAWMLAAVFALHPVHVESVAWITERKNVLSGLFVLLATLAWLRFEAAPGDRRARGWYAAALAAFVAALLAKTVAATLPVALAVVACRERRPRGRDLLPLLPMLIIGAALATVTVALERERVGAVGADFAFTAAERAAIALRALVFYPTKLLVPTPLLFIYPRWEIDVATAAAWWPALVVVAVAVGTTVAWRRGRRGIAVGLLVYAVTIAPALGLVNVYPMLFSFVADHFQYLASLGILAIAVAGAARAVGGALGRVLAATVLVALGALTWYQGQMYRDYDSGRLWAWTVRHNPGSWMARMNLGVALARQGALDAAEPHLMAAVALRAGSPLVQVNAGHLRLAQGRRGEAQDHYAKAVAADPGYAAPAAAALVAAGAPQAAIALLEEGLAAAPDDPDLRAALARARAAR